MLLSLHVCRCLISVSLKYSFSYLFICFVQSLIYLLYLILALTKKTQQQIHTYIE